MNRKKPSSGFTLVELVVVLGVVAVLLGLLLPMISRTRRRAQAVQCRSQLHQIGLAVAAYAGENRGWVLPWGGWPPYPPSLTWPQLLFGSDDSPVLICPSGVGEDRLSYLFNFSLWKNEIRLEGTNQLRLPSSDVVLASENWPRIGYQYTILVMPPGQTSYDPVRHGTDLLSNYLWLDFHVSNDPPKLHAGQTDPWDIP